MKNQTEDLDQEYDLGNEVTDAGSALVTAPTAKTTKTWRDSSTMQTPFAVQVECQHIIATWRDLLDQHNDGVKRYLDGSDDYSAFKLAEAYELQDLILAKVDLCAKELRQLATKMATLRPSEI
jgi:hypothetical protein